MRFVISTGNQGDESSGSDRKQEMRVNAASEAEQLQGTPGGEKQWTSEEQGSTH